MEGYNPHNSSDTVAGCVLNVSTRCAGFRCGALYSYNTDMLRAFGGIAHLATVSSVAQWHLRGLLEDADWVDTFIQGNCALLETLAEIVTTGLAGMGVKFIKPQVGARRIVPCMYVL